MFRCSRSRFPAGNDRKKSKNRALVLISNANRRRNDELMTSGVEYSVFCPYLIDPIWLGRIFRCTKWRFLRVIGHFFVRKLRWGCVGGSEISTSLIVCLCGVIDCNSSGRRPSFSAQFLLDRSPYSPGSSSRTAGSARGPCLPARAASSPAPPPTVSAEALLFPPALLLQRR